MKAVLFDWDGTLVDTLGVLYRANEAVFGAFGLPFDEVLYRRHYAPDWRLMYRRLGIPEDRLEDAATHWRDAFDRDAAPPFPGVVEALRRLRSAGMRLGIVTAGDRDVVSRHLEQTGIGRLLSTAVYGDDLPVHKPHPAPLRLALAELDLADEPAATVFVGDAVSDVRMARAVGVPAVGVASILGDPDELREAGAVEVVPSVVAWVDALLDAAPASTDAPGA
jgi:HAD superfamily hydrolase (TIGR01509 family)